LSPFGLLIRTVIDQNRPQAYTAMVCIAL